MSAAAAIRRDFGHDPSTALPDAWPQVAQPIVRLDVLPSLWRSPMKGYICGHTDWTSGVERMCAAEPGHVEGEHWYFDVVVLGEEDA